MSVPTTQYTVGSTLYTFTEVPVQPITTTYNATPSLVGLTPDLSTTSVLISGSTGNYFGEPITAETHLLDNRNTGREFVYIVNGAATLTVTFVDQSLCDHEFEHDVVATIPISGSKMFGPFPVSWFTSKVLMYFSGATTAKIGVFRLPTQGAGHA
jgi:hypothetical protein